MTSNGQAKHEKSDRAKGPRAGFWIRLVALGIDVVCLLSLSCIGMPLLTRLAAFCHRAVWTMTPERDLWSRFIDVVLIGYFSTELFATATPGKWFCDLMVVAPDGLRAAPLSRRLRWAMLYTPLLILALGDWLSPSLHVAMRNGFFGSAAILSAGLIGAGFPARVALHDAGTSTAIYYRNVPKPWRGRSRRSNWTLGFWAAESLLD